VDSHGKRERRPAHPDVCVLERGLYEPSQVGRKSPETQDLSIDQVRTLVLAHASFGPHEGRARVFIVRRANELSTGAANALLKTLEEPPARTYFVLLTAEGGTLLPTIRSRCQRVRFGLLGASLVESLLEAWGVAKELRAPIARRCGGSMQRALHLADTEAHDKQEAAVDELLRSLDGPNAEEALVRAEALKKLDRDALAALLTALGDALAQRATAGVRATDRQATDAANTRNAGANAEDARRDAERYALARLALRHLDRNASAQLCVESMLLRMRAVV
jgi:DNA polymerase-3 subunit delta'